MRRTSLLSRASRVLACLLGCATSVSACFAEGLPERTAQMKAAYVFNFLKFVEWSSHSPPNTIDVCFRGGSEVRNALALSAADKTIGARRIVVRSLRDHEPTSACQVLFLDSAASQSVGIGMPLDTLTIGESKTFTQGGGVIGLYTDSNRLRFTINTGNAKRANVQISSNLLKLASSVQQEPTP